MNSLGNKKIMAKNIKRYMEKEGVNQTEICKTLGIKNTTFSDWVNAKTYPRIDKIELIANYFGVNKSDLVEEHDNDNDVKTYDNIFPISVKKFPLLGEIACGEPIFANESRESYVMAGTDIDADFCLRAKGNSMMGARILDGDIVFIKETDMVNNGEIAAVIIDDEVLLKRFYYFKDENLLTLQSENPQYPPKNYKDEQLNHIRVIGRAVVFQSDIV